MFPGERDLPAAGCWDCAAKAPKLMAINDSQGNPKPGNRYMGMKRVQVTGTPLVSDKNESTGFLVSDNTPTNDGLSRSLG